MHFIKKINILFLTVLFLVHLIVLFFLFNYKNNTKIFEEIIINSTSKSQTEINCYTPFNNIEKHILKPNSKLVLKCRPLNHIEIKKENENLFNNLIISSINHELIIHNSNNTEKILISKNSTNRNSFINIVVFLMTVGKNPIWIFLIPFYSLTLIFFITINKNYIKKKYLNFTLLYHKWLNDKTDKQENNKITISTKLHYKLAGLIITTFLISLFINLGSTEFSYKEHESLRALVSLEMRISKNYIVPSKMGEPYLNKPPLFHCLLSPFTASKNHIEFTLRAFSVSFMIFIALFLFFGVKNKLGANIAWISTLLFISAHSVFGYGELQIDPFFSFICIVLFFSNFHFANTKQFNLFFILGYLLLFIGFMTKGLVMMWFFSISLLLSLHFNKSNKALISYSHLAGLMIFIILTLTYFVLYSQDYNPISFINQQVLETDSISGYSIKKIALHIISLPIKITYQFLPALALLPIIFTKKGLLNIHKNPFTKYLFYLTIVSLSVFIISPSFNSNYILMLIPLIIVLITYNIHLIQKTTLFFKIILSTILLLQFYNLSYYSIIPAIVFGLFLLNKKYQIEFLFFTLILNMIISNVFLLVDTKNNFELNVSEKIKSIIQNHSDKTILVLNKETQINDVVLFYFSYYKNQIIKLSDATLQKNNLYLANKKQLKNDFEVKDSIIQKIYTQEIIDREGIWRDDTLYLVKIK